LVKAFEIADLIVRQQESDRPYLEFLRQDSLSVGLYVLPAAAVDEQRPHSEDEVYYVVSGRGTITVAGEERAVQPGSIIFVAAGVEHRFHDISEALTILVFFAPAEGSLTNNR
jgi:mannose-6-phosphate isomerase-like protein (cupin superfamily)